MEDKTTHVSLCRPGNEALLAAELRDAGAAPLDAPGALPAAPAGGAGWLAWRADGPAAARPAPDTLVFERQRLPGAAFQPGEAAREMAGALLAAALPALAAAPPPLTLHVFAADPTGERSLATRAGALQRALEREWAARDPAGHGAMLDAERFRQAAHGGTVWQVCVVPGGSWSAVTPRDRLADAHPGGVHRMARDPAAPSRSYLKVEEALDVLAGLGIVPRARERVIDLGAAPGGWSYAFLKRGCRVLAVDNGPLKLAGLDALPGELTHLRADGLRLRPPPGWLPADWLLSDMLIAPGVCLGLLRKWIEGGWMRRCIVNVKLPQAEPLVALRPLRGYLAGVPGLRWRLRQLYHDRREVTVLAELTGPRPLREPSLEPAGRKGRRKPAPPRKGRQPVATKRRPQRRKGH